MATAMTVATAGGPVEVRFERRRYGTGASSRSFCWGHVVAPDGEPLSLGDPWPAVTPKRSEVTTAAEAALIGWSLDRMVRRGRHG